MGNLHVWRKKVNFNFNKQIQSSNSVIWLILIKLFSSFFSYNVFVNLVSLEAEAVCVCVQYLFLFFIHEESSNIISSIFYLKYSTFSFNSVLAL